MKLHRVAAITLLPALLISSSMLAQTASVVERGERPFIPSGFNSADRKNADGTITSQIHQKWANYYDEGQWKEIDLEPRETADAFVIDEAPFALELPKFADAPASFTSTNTYDIEKKRERKDAPVSKLKRFTGAEHVEGRVTELGIEYPGALPIGDIVYQADTDEFRALVRLNDLPASCKSNPAGEVLIPFTETYSGGLRPQSKGANIGATRKDVGEGYSVKLNDFRGMSTKQAMVWDSAPSENRQKIEVRGRFSTGTFDAQKVLPCAFLLAATYPVFTDTTTTFYPDPNTESSSVDGEVRTDGNVSWAAARADTNGSTANDSSTVFRVSSQCDPGPDNIITRTFILWDTTSIGASSTVTAGEVILYNIAAQRVNGDNDGQDYIALVGSTNPASTTALTTDDFDQTSDTLLSATKPDITSLSSDGTQTFTLSAAGVSAIAKSGVTKFGLREGHDLENAAIACNQNNQAGFRSADYAGTSSDPVLSVTYTPTASGRRNTSPVLWL